MASANRYRLTARSSWLAPPTAKLYTVKYFFTLRFRGRMSGSAKGIRLAGWFVVVSWISGQQGVEAQASLLGPGAAFFGAGISGMETGELDDRLAASGYPTFGRTALTIGIGAYRILSNRVMLGGEFNGLIIGEEPHDGGEVGLGGGYATLGIGYSFALSQRARFYPRLGLGVGGFGMWFDNEADSVHFDDVLTDPEPSANLRETVMSRDGLVMDAGAGVEILRGRRSNGPLVGLRFGYLFAPFDSSWDSYERKVTGGPDATISGPYVRVIIGGAWRR